MLGARSPAGEGSEFAPASVHDPSTEPTISSVRVIAGQAEATRIDPDAPIHHGAVPVENSRPSARNRVALRPGYQLKEYTLEAILGSGGFGITYRARDNNLQCQDRHRHARLCAVRAIPYPRRAGAMVGPVCLRRGPAGEKPLEAPSRARSDAMPSAQSIGKGRYSEQLLRARLGADLRPGAARPQLAQMGFFRVMAPRTSAAP